jgi:tetratricopeptide (TPR) repeat protein
MKQEFTYKQIITLLVGVVILGGALFYARQSKDPVVDDSNVVLDDGAKTDDTVVDDKTLTDADGNIVDSAKEAKMNTEKFNSTMQNAQIAFGKGEYDKSIALYKEALVYNNSDKVYSGLFFAYSAKNDITNARIALDTAIKMNVGYTDYWKWKLTLLDEKTNVSFADLKRIYEEGMNNVDTLRKFNLVTHFAVIAENNKEIAYAITLWEKAKELYPAKASVYQAEIDRLKAL